MKNFLSVFGIFFCLIALESASAQQKPNIIFILADDLGYGDVGFNGQKHIQTPHIDELAKQGVQFTNFYAGTTVCAPSRSALLTGQHTGHTFIRGNLGVDPEGQYPIADSVFTMAEMLKQAGYRTGVFGKWGLGPVGSEGDPVRQGFDQFYGYNCQSLAHRYYPTHLWDDTTMVMLNPKNSVSPEVYAPDLIQEKALAFIDENKEAPFFLFLPYILPHAELLVPQDSLFFKYKGKFPEQPYKGDDYGPSARGNGYVSQEYPRATFSAMVSRLDLYVGQVMQKLATLGIEQNTIIVFTSDNGPHREGGADPVFFNSAAGLRGVKRDLYEGGLRVPFVLRWPAVVKEGRVSDHIGAFWDVFPTLAEVAGGGEVERIDGLSFLNTVASSGPQVSHPYLYWEFHEQGGKQAIRQGDWKAIRFNAKQKTNQRWELYNLATDPAEQDNLAGQYPDRIKQMENWMDLEHQESPLFPFN